VWMDGTLNHLLEGTRHKRRTYWIQSGPEVSHGWPSQRRSCRYGRDRPVPHAGECFPGCIPFHGCDGVDQNVAVDTQSVALWEDKVFILFVYFCVHVRVCVWGWKWHFASQWPSHYFIIDFKGRLLESYSETSLTCPAVSTSWVWYSWPW